MTSAALSKRQINKRFGINLNYLDLLIEIGEIKGCGGSEKRPLYLESSVKYLQSPDLVVQCEKCGSLCGQITQRHLISCSGMTLEDYKSRFPRSPIMSDLVAKSRAKSEEEKTAQSRAMKAHFQSNEGDRTRSTISSRSKKMQEEKRSFYLEHLKKIGKDPKIREARSRNSRKMWENPEHLKKIREWQKDNREDVLKSAARARSYTRKVSSIHLSLKRELERKGVFTRTEYKVGYFSIDEALPIRKVAIEVDGCYWHGCDVCGFEGKKSARISDKRKDTYLSNKGWKVIRIKEHEINRSVEACADKIVALLRGDNHGNE